MPTLRDKLKIAQNKRLSAENARSTAAKRGYGYRWQCAREKYLQTHPLCTCAECQQRLVPLPADVVDHIIPHRGDMTLFWDKLNWQAMNHVCHNKKTATEDGGFGNNR